MQEAFDICCDMNEIVCAVQEFPVPFCIYAFRQACSLSKRDNHPLWGCAMKVI